MAGSGLGIAVFGTGRIGRMHAELIAHRVPGARLAGVFDVAAGAAEAVASELGCARFASVDEALAAEGVDAVAICTSTDTHVELVVEVTEAGKAILCEKPVSLDLIQVDRALAAVASAGVPFQVGFNRRFDRAHRAVAEAVAAGRIGEVHLVRITSRDPAPPPIAYIEVSGGLFLDMTIHDFDMARFVTGSEVESVHAVGAVRVDPAIGEAGDIDTAVVTLEHTNGAITTIDNSRRAVYGYDQRVEAFGSAGMVASHNPPAHTTVSHDESGGHAATLPHFFLDRYVPSYVAEWEAFVAAVSQGTPVPVDGVDGRAPLVIGLAAREAMRLRRPVRCDEIG
ncbi:MAG: inositol 2-dehydrogenase [Acidimicrobiales bacterium]